MSGDGLVPPLNAPPAGNPTPGVQPGTSNAVVIANLVIIFGPASQISGLFIYQPGTTPGAGNPPIVWATAGSKDPYGNTLAAPGVMLAEAASSGNAVGGLIWNTAVPGAAEPLLALYPDATVGFTGNSPFVLGRVFNRGLVNELLGLAFGGGGTAGSSPVQMEIFSQSKDGTKLGHISFYDWASTNLICDINVNGIQAADPSTPNTVETWHTLGVDAGWTQSVSNPVSYRLLPDGNVQFSGTATHAGFLVTTALASGANLLPAAYRPASAQEIPVGLGTNNATGIAISTSGLIQCRVNVTGTSTTTAAPQGIYRLK